MRLRLQPLPGAPAQRPTNWIGWPNITTKQKAIFEKDPGFGERCGTRCGLDAAPSAEAAAWVGVSRVLLNLDEFITRE